MVRSATHLCTENKAAMKKVLFATIVPFWLRRTGAQQRIFSMVKVLEAHGHQVRVFFPGHAEPSDRESAQRLGLDVAFHSSDQPVADESLAQKIKWQVEAVRHAVQNVAGGRGGKAVQKRPLRLSDFRWPWAEVAFEKAVAEFSAQAIVCEYITMAYLVEALPVDLRSKIHCLVDTHDLLSHRQQEFADRGHPHWIDVSTDEEVAALQAFDTIVAIQEDEALTFQKMVPDSSVVVVGHQPLVAESIDVGPPKDSDVLTIGYLGSSNASNVDAVNGFLDAVWRTFEDQSRIRLVVAGDASDKVLSELRFKNVKLLGRVAEVRDFYAQVDAVINPVGYGTGLKIKSVEAIAYGKPLLCTSSGWSGNPVGGVAVVDRLQDMTEVISIWLKERASFERIRMAAWASSQLSGDEVYRPLLEVLK